MLSLVQATDTAHLGQRLTDAPRPEDGPGAWRQHEIDIGAWLRQHQRERPVSSLKTTDGDFGVSREREYTRRRRRP